MDRHTEQNSLTIPGRPRLRRARNFLRDVRGNIAVTFALSVLPVIFVIGSVVDYSRVIGVDAALQQAASAGALAGANLLDVNGNPEDVARAYALAALASRPALADIATVNVTSDVSLNAKYVHVTVSADVPTIFMGIAGINSIPVSREAEAEEVKMNVEISMVLDISSSMNQGRIDNLRTAAQEFVETVLEGENALTTTVSVIPFGGTVRLRQHMFDLIIDAPTYEYTSLGYSVPLPQVQQEWNGCAEMTPDQVRSIDLEENTLGVVHYYTVWNGNNPWCPNDPAGRATFINSSAENLVDLFEGFDESMLSDGTGTDVGMSWGVRALDPVWQGRLRPSGAWAQRPAPYEDESTRKVLIVMSDGGVTGQLRPKFPMLTASLDGVDPDFSAQTVPTAAFYNAPQAYDNFAYLCDYAKDNGVIIFSIAFNIRTQGQKNQMQACATSNAHFFDVQTLDIGQAFRVITEQISSLRLTR